MLLNLLSSLIHERAIQQIKLTFISILIFPVFIIKTKIVYNKDYIFYSTMLSTDDPNEINI